MTFIFLGGIFLGSCYFWGVVILGELKKLKELKELRRMSRRWDFWGRFVLGKLLFFGNYCFFLKVKEVKQSTLLDGIVFNSFNSLTSLTP
jgi:hypothetical protein